jgi:hypothetical protein
MYAIRCFNKLFSLDLYCFNLISNFDLSAQYVAEMPVFHIFHVLLLSATVNLVPFTDILIDARCILIEEICSKSSPKAIQGRVCGPDWVVS